MNGGTARLGAARGRLGAPGVRAASGATAACWRRAPRPTAAAAARSARARVVSFKSDPDAAPPAAAVAVAAAPLAPRPAAPNLLPTAGGVVAPRDAGVQLACSEPTYGLRLTYSRAGRPLAGCDRIIARIGHSGWSNTADVELTPSPADPDLFEGAHGIPASQLANPAHAEVQVVFRGVGAGGRECWDNNGGHDWQLSVELAQEGLVLPAERAGPMRALVSSLLLRLDALAAAGLLTAEQFASLRNQAWAQDFALVRAYQTVRDVADDSAVASLLLSRFNFLRRPGLHVVHVASEMVPVAKVGGLGDVVTGLAKAHQQSGILSEVILPKYDCIAYAAIQELRPLRSIEVAFDGRRVATRVWSGVVEGLPVTFLEPSNGMFWRRQFYGAPDDLERFMFFARAALEWLLASGKQPDVLHLHDWQSAAVAPLLAEEFRGRGLTQPRCVFTIHNIAFQGWMTPPLLSKVGLDPDRMARPDAMLDDSRPGFAPGSHDCSLLRGAIAFSDRVTTVSPTYAREVFLPEFGMGAQAILSRHRHKFSGILNGIDNDNWCPEADPFLPAHFSAADRAGKEDCKRLLLEELGLPYTTPNWVLQRQSGGQHQQLQLQQLQQHADQGNGNGNGNGAAARPGRPLLAVVSRLTEQKGLPLIEHGIKTALARGAQVVVLGAASEPDVQRRWEDMARDHGSGPDARIVLRYDEGLAHRIYAAADAILVPSFFEPCGLTQLIALRYGTIPIVNRTGGLADTVRDVADGGVPENARNGFVLNGREEARVQVAVDRAMDAFLDANEWWRGELVARAMAQDWSWSRSAADYLSLYRGAL
ncbi:starch synthase, chloroplastic-like protein [Raphidocelis subcapitata]|uniref:starch synthase n=1 Tax=Raphidocelis subcapitata TaxID=307507 RepID=A0A2V0NM55_9CHLO|nr:starch synthase, chloroplastic-like protein [Raphidocelis subcapitata]|eukprot:GBF88551.1 starch synthase, chloroplastic-like protein [Raphidocelis subcapitata]